MAQSIDADIGTLGVVLAPLAPKGMFLSTALEELRCAAISFRCFAMLTDIHILFCEVRPLIVTIKRHSNDISRL